MIYYKMLELKRPTAAGLDTGPVMFT